MQLYRMSSQDRGTRGSCCNKNSCYSSTPAKRCHLPVLQCTAVQNKNWILVSLTALAKHQDLFACFSKFIPLQVFISFTSLHTEVDVLFSHLQTAVSLLLSHSPCFYSAPSSPSLFSPCKTLSYSLWGNKMKLWSDFKVLLCRSAARWSIQQNMHSRGRQRKAGNSLFSGFLMSYKLENTDSSRTSLCSPSKE